MEQVGGRDVHCRCDAGGHATRLVVVTGGPGAGKTAVLELARHATCEHVVVLPEAAGIVFGGGFPRHTTDLGRRAAQRVIIHAERQMELLFTAEADASVVLCDRGTLDGLAYWPGDPDELLVECGPQATLASELARYARVVHLRTPNAGDGYDHSNPLRIEDARTAREIDERILDIWSGHPHRVVVEAHTDFPTKAAEALRAILATVPDCCRPIARVGAGVGAVAAGEQGAADA